MPLLRGVTVLCLASASLLCAAAPPPVVLISIDTLRADHLGIYGNRHIATPNIDSFADNGTVFTDIACQTPLTLPSHTTLFTSTYPFENGIQENAEQVPAGAVTLAAVLKSHGYKTAAFIGSVFLERQMGLDQGFDTYDSPFNFEAFSPLSGELFFGGIENPYNVRDRRDGALVVSSALRWISANRTQPAFVFIHLFDLHTPYSLAPRKGLSRYDTQLEYADELIGRLKKGLIQNGWWDRALTVLLSDHGEGLGDHGETAHGYFIYQSTIHVPLIIHGTPGRVEQPGGLIDVAPTILDLLHIPAPPSFEGTTLLTNTPRSVYSETLHTHDSFGWSPLRSIRLGKYKYIEAPHAELYDLDNDPAERTNIMAANPGAVRTLRGELTKLQARYPRHASTTQAANPQTQKLLNSLGYVAPGPHPTGPQPDPKDRLPEYRLYENSMDAQAHGHPAQAAALLQQILTQDPTNTLARRDLGSCYLDLRQYEKARAALEKVAIAAPNDYATQYGLGLANKHLGHNEEARQNFEAASRLAPNSSQARRELSLKQ